MRMLVAFRGPSPGKGPTSANAAGGAPAGAVWVWSEQQYEEEHEQRQPDPGVGGRAAPVAAPEVGVGAVRGVAALGRFADPVVVVEARHAARLARRAVLRRKAARQGEGLLVEGGLLDLPVLGEDRRGRVVPSDPRRLGGKAAGRRRIPVEPQC